MGRELRTNYPERFYDGIRSGSIASAAVVVPVVLRHFRPTTVIDVGCGEGHWGRAFADHGCRASGIDGDYVRDPVIPFEAIDLEQPLPDLDARDLAVSLEVAEHLSPSRAAGFVADLCRLAPVVVFSAAVPGQGGTDHRNEQWPDYWAELFKAHDYVGSGALRWQVWEDERVKWWYRQNLLVFARRELPAGLPQDGCPAVVHRDMWAHHGRGHG